MFKHLHTVNVTFTSSDFQCQFSQKPTVIPHPDVFVKGEKLKVISDFKYLGVIIDSQLTFQKVAKINLANFRHSRPCLTIEAAKLFMHNHFFLYYILFY